MRISNTEAWRIPRRRCVVLAMALSWAAVSSTSNAQSQTDAAKSAALKGPGGDAVISGHVVQQEGKPVGGASVLLIGARDTVVTTQDGAFTLHAPAGAYILVVRRLGFRLERFAVTLTANETRDVTIEESRAVPVLPTVTTTAQERAAYRSVGFEQRMEAGNGQFLTYEQIQQKQEPRFSLLLRGMRGIKVWKNPNPAMQFGDVVEGTRGAGSCVSFMVDGVPQMVLNSRDADNIIDISSVAAVEVYSSAERPSQFLSLEEHPLETGNPQSDPTDPTQRIRVDQQCTLVMVWTLGRLGLPTRELKPAEGGAPAAAESSGEVTEGVAVFGDESICKPGLPEDTTNLVIYATLEGSKPATMSDIAWARYKDSTLSVLERFAALPSQVILPAFGLPLGRTGTSVDASGADDGHMAAPVLSNVIALTLDSIGALRHADVAASSLSGAADTSVLATVEHASAAHVLPRLPTVSAPIDSVRLYVVVASVEPAPGLPAAVFGQLEVPVWLLRHQARLVPNPPNQGYVAAADSLTVEMVIDQAGHADLSTVRTIANPSTNSVASRRSAMSARKLVQPLNFDPAVVGTCRVPQLVVQKLAVHEAVDGGP